MQLDSGDLLVVYREASSHTGTDGVLRKRTSTDGGATWSSATTIHTPSGGNSAGGVSAVKLANGKVLLTFWELISGGGDWTSFSMLSTDATATAWDTPVALTTSFSTWNTVESPAWELDNGDLVTVLAGISTAETNSSVRMSRSTDGGASWADDGLVASGPAITRDLQEPVMLVMDNGDWLVMIRSDTGTPGIYMVTSQDEGGTWSSPRRLWDGRGRPSTVQRPEGPIVCLYRTNNPNDDFRIRTSWDRARSWTTTDGDLTGGSGLFFAYGAGQALADGTTAVVYSLEQAGATDADLWYVELT